MKIVLVAAVFTIILFTLFRFSYLTTSPSGFFVDESSIGYNAFSILKTGKDEYGKTLPLYFEAFGDYKNPIFIYSVVPLIAIFGETITSVRLASAIWGGAAIIIFLYLLKYSKTPIHTTIFSVLLVVTTPWFIQLSRVAFEVASLPFFLLSAILCFYILVHHHFKNWKQSLVVTKLFSLSLGLLFYTYTSARVLSPLLLFFGIFLLRKKIGWKNCGVAVAIFSLCLLPLFVSESFQNGAMMARYNIVGLSHYTDNWYDFAATAVKNYLNHFSPQFLWQAGDENLRHVVRGYGVFLSSSLIFILAGIYSGLKKKKDVFFRWILFGLLISPIPSALTIQSPHVLRSVGMLGFAFICMWYGVTWFLETNKKKKIIGLLLLSVVMIQSLFFLHFYFFEFSEISRPWFDAGTVESIETSFTQPGPYYFSNALYPGTYATIEFFNNRNEDLYLFDSTVEIPQLAGTYVYDYSNCVRLFQYPDPSLQLISQIDGVCVVRNAGNF